MELQELKEYLRIDGNDQDAHVGMLKKAAEIYVAEKTDRADFNFDAPFVELADLAVAILVTRWYENPDSMGKDDNLAHGLDDILRTLRYGGDPA